MGVMKEHQWQISSISSCCVKEQYDLWVIVVRFWDVTALNTIEKGQLIGFPMTPRTICRKEVKTSEKEVLFTLHEREEKISVGP